MIDRMKGAAMLEVATYEEVEADTSATGQAGMVVLLAAIAQAIAGIGQGGVGIVGGAVAALVGWVLWSGITYLGELLRTIGFAHAPQVLVILAFLPILGGLIRVVVAIWMLIAGIIAIRQALDFSTGKAVATALLGWLAIAIPAAILMGGIGLGR
jgi:hypothetical protein